MKTTDEESKNAGLLLFLTELADMWALGRGLIEHERASTSPADQPYTEREILVLCLVEEFEGLVTATTLCKVFGLAHSQVGKLIEGLVDRDLLKKSTEPVSRKSGKGTPLQLGAKAKETLKRIKLGLGSQFGYLYKQFSPEEVKQMSELTKKMHAAARQRFEERVFRIGSSILR